MKMILNTYPLGISRFLRVFSDGVRAARRACLFLQVADKQLLQAIDNVAMLLLDIVW
jgi:hypothetical protein